MNKKNKTKTQEKAQFGRLTNSLRMGIVGFPNVGKSSTFNLLSKLGAQAENYPFCTIDPNLAKVPVPDPRFEKLCEFWKPKSKVPTSLTIYDIAGLVPNAHKGEGLGNEFLSHIQAVDGIYHMVRAFADNEVVHTEGDVNPVRDMAVISNELIQKDLISVNKRIKELELKIEKLGDDKAKKELEHMLKAKACLDKGTWIKDNEWSNVEILILNDMLFFTAKPVIYLINISTPNFQKKKNKWLIKIKTWINENCPGIMIPFSVSYEEKLQRGEVKGTSMIDKIIKIGYKTLNLEHFFTCGRDEVRCWTIKKGFKAPQAAGVIHTDFEKGFISAEVYTYDDFVKFGSEKEVKNNGKYKQCGKEYLVKDGDIIFFKFKKPKDGVKKK